MKYFNQNKQQGDPLIILYDGYCMLCSRIVQFIYKWDRRKKFIYCPVQSVIGDDLRAQLMKGDHPPESVIFIASGNTYIKSDAALEIFKNLGFPLKIFWILIIIPRFIRDPIYSYIAKNRFRWFGRRESCFLPGMQKESGAKN